MEVGEGIDFHEIETEHGALAEEVQGLAHLPRGQPAEIQRPAGVEGVIDDDARESAGQRLTAPFWEMRRGPATNMVNREQNI